jgi:hypothetical protein
MLKKFPTDNINCDNIKRRTLYYKLRSCRLDFVWRDGQQFSVDSKTPNDRRKLDQRTRLVSEQGGLQHVYPTGESTSFITLI